MLRLFPSLSYLGRYSFSHQGGDGPLPINGNANDIHVNPERCRKGGGLKLTSAAICQSFELSVETTVV